jgi:hypothetical protein
MRPDTQDENDLMDWVSLGSVLVKLATRDEYAAVYDTIKLGGIFSLDDFNRPQQAEPGAAETVSALEIVLSVWNHDAGNDLPGDDDRHPIDRSEGYPDDPFVLFGWPSQHLPTFQKVDAAGSLPDDSLSLFVPLNRRSPALPASVDIAPEKAARVSDLRRRLDTQLVIIQALLSKLGIDPAKGGAASKVVQAVGDIGTKIDEGTVLKVLSGIADAIEKRSPG